MMVLLRAFRLAGSLVVAFGVLVPLLMAACAAGLRPLVGHLQVALCRVLLAGLDVKVSGALTPSAPTLLVANHVSWLDILVIGSRLPVCFLAKSEVRAWPLVGALARRHGTVFVDRARRRTIVPANAAIASRLAARLSVVLFAEGTTSGGPVLPFRTSHLASLQRLTGLGASGARVQAVAIRFSHPVAAWVGDESLVLHLVRLLRAPPVSCTLQTAAPRTVAPGFDRKALGRALHLEVTEVLAAGAGPEARGWKARRAAAPPGETECPARQGGEAVSVAP